MYKLVYEMSSKNFNFSPKIPTIKMVEVHYWPQRGGGGGGGGDRVLTVGHRGY